MYPHRRLYYFPYGGVSGGIDFSDCAWQYFETGAEGEESWANMETGGSAEVTWEELICGEVTLDYLVALTLNLDELPGYSPDGSDITVDVKRSGDGATQTFSLDEVLDGTATAFVNAGGGTQEGFVAEWVDNSGNSNSISQSTASAQPLLIENGALLPDGMRLESAYYLDEGNTGLAIGLNDFVIYGQGSFDSGTPSSSMDIFTTHLGGSNRAWCGITSAVPAGRPFFSFDGNIFYITLSQTIPDLTPINWLLEVDRDNLATFTWKDALGNTGTGSVNVSSTSTINIGDGNTNPWTLMNDTDSVGNFRKFFVINELIGLTSKNQFLNLSLD